MKKKQNIRQTKIIKISDDKKNDLSFLETNTELQAAAKSLSKGCLVAFPTETVYGLGANALDPHAVNNIFVAKGRPSDNPLIVHICSTDELSGIVQDISEPAKTLMKAFWPGPLTIIMKKNMSVPSAVTAGLNTVAVRMPSNKVARTLIKLSGVPVAAPSANLSGKPSPTCAEHVIEDLYGKVDFIIDAGCCEVGLESTVIDATINPPVLLRPGGITLSQLEMACGSIKIDQSILSKIDKNFIPRSPGMKYRHYSPKAPLYIIRGSLQNTAACITELAIENLCQNKKVGILASEQSLPLYKSLLDKFCYNNNIFIISAGSRNNPPAVASELFKILRRFDNINVDIILSEYFDDSDLGMAIMNRLLKASGYNIIDAVRTILFVCTGNTCRSSMAEAIFNSTISADKELCNRYIAKSAGTHAFDGDGASVHSQNVLKKLWNIDISNHRARKITKDMLQQSFLVLTMTLSHKIHLCSLFPEYKHKIFTLGEYAMCEGNCEKLNVYDIPDPFGQSEESYEKCAQKIKTYIDKIIFKLYNL